MSADKPTRAQRFAEWIVTYESELHIQDRREIAAELRRLSEIEADKDRLDFIEKHPDMQLRFYKKRWAMRGFTNYEFDVFLTAREAIDAAIRARKDIHD